MFHLIKVRNLHLIQNIGLKMRTYNVDSATKIIKRVRVDLHGLEDVCIIIICW